MLGNKVASLPDQVRRSSVQCAKNTIGIKAERGFNKQLYCCKAAIVTVNCYRYDIYDDQAPLDEGTT
jgi:hypothetical protein